MAPIDMPPALVEGLDVSAYGITRSLGRHGVPVYALNNHLRDALRRSRYCRGCFLFPDDPAQPRAYAADSVPNEDVLARLMLDWVERLPGRPVLFATSDWFARFLSRRRQELESRFQFHWIEPELFSTIADKGRMAAFCERAGVRAPRTYVSRENDDITAIAAGLPYPCLVKPVHRYTASFPMEAAKVFVAQTSGELQGFFAKYPQMKGATLVQELIEGGDDQVFQCTALVNQAGDITAYSTVRKLCQYPGGYGSMCYGRTEPNETLAAEALKLVRALGYRGLGSLEFKHRQKDGGYYFIEMNTRLPWYNGIFADADVNLPHLAYLDLTGQTPASPLSLKQRHNVAWMSVHNYSLWRKEARNRKALSRAAYWSAIAGAQSYAWWNRRDPGPFLASCWFRVRAWAGEVLRRLGLRK
jgi:D-aspartate ligase